MKEITQNLIVFMERVPVTGKEAIAWIQAYSYLQEQLNPKPAEIGPVKAKK